MRPGQNTFDHDAGPVVASDILASEASTLPEIRAIAEASLATLYAEPHGVQVAIDSAGGGWLVVTVDGPRACGQIVLELCTAGRAHHPQSRG